MAPWWEGAVLYQIYPRSFQDSNGDGIGDLAGIVRRLDHLAWLGVDALWLNPTYPSADADWGYDVVDYTDVHPDLGTLTDLDRLIAEASARGIRILLDLVQGHTSDRHPWFRTRRDWYTWVAGAESPNDWLCGSAASAWTHDPTCGRSYLHTFRPEQPDLNWWSEEVREEFDRILAYWFARGVAGFRIDAAARVVKSRDLAAPAAGPWLRPPPDLAEVHAVLRRWRNVAERYGDRLLLGQTWIEDAGGLSAFFGENDELHIVHPFALSVSQLYALVLHEIVGSVEASLQGRGSAAWQASSHDVIRFPTRWGAGDERRTRAALMLLLGLRGTVILYYGDEIGMSQTNVPARRARDHWGRDGCRTPMQWADVPGGGFTDPDVEPWLPLGDLRVNVESQRDDPASTLSLCRDLIALRRQLPELATGCYEPIKAPPGVWACRRGERVVVVANLSGAATRLTGVEGTVRLATERARDGEIVKGALRLEPWEAVVVAD